MPHWAEQQAPPWRVFPGMKPEELGATQGAQEAWLDGVWRPFWAGLSPDAREQYLLHWQASGEWREWIAFVCEPAPFDAEADAAESERWLAERAAPPAPEGQPGLLQRWFGPRRKP